MWSQRMACCHRGFRHQEVDETYEPKWPNAGTSAQQASKAVLAQSHLITYNFFLKKQTRFFVAISVKGIMLCLNHAATTAVTLAAAPSPSATAAATPTAAAALRYQITTV